MTMPPMSTMENLSTARELHQMQAASSRAKKRLVSRRGGSLPSTGVRACCTTEPPPLTYA